jgi:hypothetical protein
VTIPKKDEQPGPPLSHKTTGSFTGSDWLIKLLYWNTFSKRNNKMIFDMQ